MIPKIIHHIWVGGNEKPAQIKKCMKTWDILRDTGYEIIEWNESNFNIDSHPFAKSAYENKKWAFVSDYIRLYVIHKYGGVYLDSDMLVLKDIEPLLNDKAFLGFESFKHPSAGMLGAEKGHPLFKKLIDRYMNKVIPYSESPNFYEHTINLELSKILTNDYKWQLNNKQQVLGDGITVYPDYYLFSPSLKSFAIHVHTGSWTGEKNSFWRLATTYLRGNSDKKIILLLLLFLKKIRNYSAQLSAKKS